MEPIEMRKKKIGVDAPPKNAKTISGTFLACIRSVNHFYTCDAKILVYYYSIFISHSADARTSAYKLKKEFVEASWRYAQHHEKAVLILPSPS